MVEASVICIDELPGFDAGCAGMDIVSAECKADVFESDSSVNPYPGDLGTSMSACCLDPVQDAYFPLSSPL